ncbi:MAG: hypothetical protein AAGA23_14825 [Pseudomonadota bacterium]
MKNSATAKRILTALVAIPLQTGLLRADENQCWPLDLDFDRKTYEAMEADLAARWEPAQRYADFLNSGKLLQRLQVDSAPEARLMSVALALHQATDGCEDPRCSSLVLDGPAGQTALAELTSLAADYPQRIEFSMAALQLCQSVRDDRTACSLEYADGLVRRFPDNAAAALASSVAALERGDPDEIAKRLQAAANASYFDSGVKALGEIGITLLDQHLPPAATGELEGLRGMMVYSRPGLDYLSTLGIFPGISDLMNFCAVPPDENAAQACLQAAQSMRLPGALGMLDLEAETIEIRIIEGSGNKPSEAVHQLVREYPGNRGTPPLDWSNPKALLQYQIDLQELGYLGALARYRELEQACAAKRD